jgi:O-antigen/teichoic acid export membrane protein
MSKPRSLRRRLFSNAAWSIGGRGMSMGSLFASSVLLARNLSTAEFSAYTIAAAAVALLAMPAAFGAPRVVLRLIREGIAANSPQLIIDSLRECIRLVAVTSAVLVLMFVVGVGFLKEADKWQAIRDYSLLVGAWFSLSAFCLALSHALQGFDDFRSAAMVGARSGGILPNLLFLAVVAIAAWMDALTLRFTIAAQVALLGLTAAWALYALWRAMAGRALMRDGLRNSDEPAHAVTPRWFFHECWPLVAIQLTSLGIAQIDVLLVGWLSQSRDIAIYGAVARLGELLAAAQILAAGIAAPFISELYATGQLRKLERLLRGIASMVAIPTLLIGAGFIVAPRLILTHTFGPSFAAGATTLQIVTLGSMVASLTGTNSLALIMAGQQRPLLSISVVASAMYLLVAPLLISRFGIVGAAAATAVVFGIYNIVVTAMVKSRLGIWTTASLSPAVYIDTIREVFRR